MLTDSDTIAEAQDRMYRAAIALGKMAPDVANAKQVKEYDTERRKRALSVLVVEQVRSGHLKMSMTEAEHLARASDGYGAQLNDLSEQLRSALRVIEEHDSMVIMYESARSILSMEKAKVGL